MSLLDRIFRRKRAAPLPVPPPEFSFSVIELLGGSDPEAALDMTKNEQASAYLGWVYAAVSLISQDVRAASQAASVYQTTKDGLKREVRDHRLLRILRRPNMLETGGDFFERSNLFLDLLGEVFWLIVTGSRGEVVGLQIISPLWIDRPVVENGRLVSWRITYPGGNIVEAPARDVIRVFYPHPLDPWQAASPVEAVAASQYFDIYLRAYGASLMKNDGAIPAGLISTEQDITREEADIISERWKNRYQSRRDGVAVLGRGAKYQPIAVPISDINFLHAARFARDQILAIYRVPASKLGLVEDVNRANAEVNDRSYKEAALRPRLWRYADVINEHLLPRVDRNASLTFEFKDPVEEDAEIRLKKFINGLRAGAVMVDEYRKYIGLDPLPDGKGQVIMVPAGVVATSEPEGASYKPAAGSNASAGEGQKAFRAIDDDKLELAALRWLKVQEPLERKLKSQVRSLLSREQRAVIAKIKAGEVLPKTRDWYDDATEDSHDEWIAIFVAMMIAAIADGWELASEQFAGYALSYDAYIDAAASYAAEQAGKLVGDISATTRKELSRIIEQAITNGWSEEETARRVAELYDGWKGSRAATIARTEVARALNYGVHWHAREIAQKYGLRIVKQWSAVNDSRTRYTHALAHGQKRLLDEPFEVGGALLMHPGDPSGPPQETVNCRCVEVLEVQE